MELSLNTDDYFQTSELLHKDQFSQKNVFDLLKLKNWLPSFLAELGVQDEPLIKGDVDKQAVLSGPVFVAKGARVEPMAYLQGPLYIGPDAEVRHGAYLRGHVYVGARAVVGHTTETKNSIFLDDAKAAHFAYVGDSILGRNVNLGAGTKLANFKFGGKEVTVKDPYTKKNVATGLRKLGAIIGDGANTGCNAVLNPGTIMFPNTAVLACIHYRGTLTEGMVTLKGTMKNWRV